jgi:hypothetical protein
MAAVLSAEKGWDSSFQDNYPAFVLGWGYRNIMIVFGSWLSGQKTGLLRQISRNERKKTDR